MQAVRIWPWDQASYNRPRAFRLLRMHTGTGFRSICMWWPVRSLAAYTMNTGVRRRRRDIVFADYKCLKLATS